MGNGCAKPKALARLAQHLGVSVAAYQPYGRDPNRTWKAALPDCLDTLRELVAVIKSSGVRFGLELHSGSPFETLQQVRRLVDEIPGIPIAYDPSHFVMQGIDLKDTVWMFPMPAMFTCVTPPAATCRRLMALARLISNGC